MAKYRAVQTIFWNDSKVIEDMTPDDKLFYLYLLTNPSTKQIGIYQITRKQMSFELGFSIEVINTLMNRFENNLNLIKYDENTREICIKNWGKYNLNNGGKPVEDCIRKELKEIKNVDFIKIIYKKIENEKIKSIFNEFLKSKEDDDIIDNIDMNNSVNSYNNDEYMNDSVSNYDSNKHMNDKVSNYDSNKHMNDKVSDYDSNKYMNDNSYACCTNRNTKGVQKETEKEEEKHQQYIFNKNDAENILKISFDNISNSDVNSILNVLNEKGRGVEYLKEKISIVKEKRNVNNIIGYLINAILNDYKNVSRNSFKNFDENFCDYTNEYILEMNRKKYE
ncbi:hypothetical protein [Peptacetobacter sp.]|uniref:hypothetical protein n=1 Tax=Peptacetobacter sp. TaxID=2991975 RepID=UPI0026236BC1|nr:hypothetical protein [Peptacetobacter sp.]